jgi:hypothetical protein
MGALYAPLDTEEHIVDSENLERVVGRVRFGN